MIEYTPYVLDAAWKDSVTGPGDFASAAYGIDTIHDVLNQNYGYHSDRQLITELEQSIFENKKIKERGLPTEEETAACFELFEKAWSVFTTKVDTKEYSVSLATKQRIDAFEEFREFLAFQVANISGRNPRPADAIMDKLRDLQIEFQTPFSYVCNIQVGSEVYNTKLAQTKTMELLSQCDAKRRIVEEFISTLD